MRVFRRMIHRRYVPVVVVQRLLRVLLLMLVRETVSNLYGRRSDNDR